jgi:hypothetical protein
VSWGRFDESILALNYWCKLKSQLYIRYLKLFSLLCMCHKTKNLVRYYQIYSCLLFWMTMCPIFKLCPKSFSLYIMITIFNVFWKKIRFCSWKPMLASIFWVIKQQLCKNANFIAEMFWQKHIL